MAVAGRLRTRMRRFLARPGTVDLDRYSDLLKEIEWREEKLREALRRGADRGRREAAGQGACGDEEGRAGRSRTPTSSSCARSGARPAAAPWTSARTTCSCWARWACSPGTSCRWPPVRARRSPARSPRPVTRLAGRHVHVLSRQRLPRPPRRRVDGPGLRAARRVVGWVSPEQHRRGAQGRLRQGRHLRRRERGRLRRAARPAGHRRGRPGAARARRGRWWTRPTRCSSTRRACRW